MSRDILVGVLIGFACRDDIGVREASHRLGLTDQAEDGCLRAGADAREEELDCDLSIELRS